MIWLNGDFLETGALSTADRGFLLGDGLFETMLVVDGAPAFLTAHLKRLGEGLSALKLDVSIDNTALRNAIGKLAEAAGLAKGRAVARLTVSRGPGPRGLKFPSRDAAAPTVLLTIAPAQPPSSAVANVMISAYPRPMDSLAARHKTLNYLDNVMAANEAAEAGRDDAIMLNARGDAVCAAAANLFLLTDAGELATPLISDGALPGIVRSVLIDCAKRAGVKVTERSISEQEIRQLPLILTSSVTGLRRAAYEAADVWRVSQQALFDRLDNAYKQALEADIRTEKAS